MQRAEVAGECTHIYNHLISNFEVAILLVNCADFFFLFGLCWYYIVFISPCVWGGLVIPTWNGIAGDMQNL